jgi:hypothetical protein
MNVRAIGGLLLALMAILLVVNPPLVGLVRTHVLDSYQLLNSLQSGQQAQKDLPLVIVDLDDESQRRIGQWPWPRSRLGEVGVEQLVQLVAGIDPDHHRRRKPKHAHGADQPEQQTGLQRGGRLHPTLLKVSPRAAA